MRSIVQKIVISLLLFFSFCIPSSISADEEIFHFYKNLDWDFFFDKLEVSFDICKCEIESQDQWLAGFKTKLVEPIGMVETSPIPWYFVGLGTKMDKSLTRKQGISRDTKDQSNFIHAHFIIFPVLGLTLGLVQDFFCFERANIFNMAYLSEVIPSYNNDVIALAVESGKPISKIWFNNPIAELACSSDCVSSTLGYPSNSLYWCDGCRGSVSASDTGFARTGRPYEDAESVAFRVLDNMHMYGGMLKTKESFFMYNPAGSNLKSSLCKARYFPVIVKDQYFLQLAKGSKGWDAEPFGKMRFHYDFKSSPTDEDAVFFWLWRERDFCSGGGVCRSTFTGQ